MNASPVRDTTRDRARWLIVAASCLAVLAALIVRQLPAQALPDPATPVTGNATHFDGLGQPYGGCGLPQSELESADFVALNVYNTPHDYAFYPRPVTDTGKVGMWNNGLNCGRWVQVTIGDYCTGTNDGAQNQAFCRNGSWVSDAYNGATLTMLVADSCGDANAWCRDDPYHLDLATDSLNRFVKNGVAVGDMNPTHWNNRHVSWTFVPAPGYSGDIRIGFLQGAQVWWPAIAVSHLVNGAHSVEYYANGAWQRATMDGDMGQAYVIGGTTSGANQFQIRVRDVNDQLINNGRVYSFTLPSSCASQCSPAYTKVSYTTSDGTTGSPSPSTSTSTSTSPSASPSASSSAGGACTASYKTTNSWSGGFQAEVTVKAGASAINGWSVRWTAASGQAVTQVWNATLTSGSSSSVVIGNASWNGALAAGASTSFGFLATGTPSSPALTCGSP